MTPCTIERLICQHQQTDILSIQTHFLFKGSFWLFIFDTQISEGQIYAILLIRLYDIVAFPVLTSRANTYQERNWVFATNSLFVKPISFQPYDVNLWYFKLTLFIVWNMKDLRHWVAKILKLENQSLRQKSQFLYLIKY